MRASPTTDRPPAADLTICQAGLDKSSARPDIEIARLAAIEKSILTLEELCKCGLSRQAVALRTRTGRLHRIHDGVYAVAHPNISVESCFVAAVKACRPCALLSHFAAAAHRGYVRWDYRTIEVTVPSSRRVRRPGLKVHGSADLDAIDLAHHRGIPITSPARTLLDLASVVDAKRLRRAMNHALAIGDVTLGELADVLVRLGPRRGSRNFAELLAAGPEPTRSELEDVVLALILNGGLLRPDVNVPIWLSGRKVVPDFRWPEQHLVVEADSSAWHDNKLARENDAERQALLEDHGEQVRRVTWDQAVLTPGQTLRRLVNAGAPPARPGALSSTA